MPTPGTSADEPATKRVRAGAVEAHPGLRGSGADAAVTFLAPFVEEIDVTRDYLLDHQGRGGG